MLPIPDKYWAFYEIGERNKLTSIEIEITLIEVVNYLQEGDKKENLKIMDKRLNKLLHNFSDFFSFPFSFLEKIKKGTVCDLAQQGDPTFLPWQKKFFIINASIAQFP